MRYYFSFLFFTCIISIFINLCGRPPVGGYLLSTQVHHCLDVFLAVLRSLPSLNNIEELVQCKVGPVILLAQDGSAIKLKLQGPSYVGNPWHYFWQGPLCFVPNFIFEITYCFFLKDVSQHYVSFRFHKTWIRPYNKLFIIVIKRSSILIVDSCQLSFWPSEFNLWSQTHICTFPWGVAGIVESKILTKLFSLTTIGLILDPFFSCICFTKSPATPSCQ